MEIPVDRCAGGLLQDIDDGMGISIEANALELAEPPLMVSGTPDVAVSFNSSMQMVSGSFCGRPKRTVSKTDWTMYGVTQFCRAISEKEAVP